ncbi:MAG: LysR family transcriptional regulator [Alkalibacterium sp.]|nr:LysR family transcriptional regulator [Alkalibacterium sp.]
MKLQDLHYFKQLAETRSFTETAEAFYISQPSISIALKRLEEEFSTRLITRDRSSKSVELTKSGELLYQRSLDILHLVNKTKKDIHDLESKNVYLGFLPTIGGHFLPKLFPELTSYLGSLKFVEEESSDAMFEMVKTNRVSAAIVGSDVPHVKEKWLTQVPIAEKEMYVWVSPTHPLAKYKRVKAAMLEKTNFVTLAKGYTHQRIFEKWTNEHAIDVSNIHYTNEIQTANSMIASGMSAGLMIDLLVSDRKGLVKIPLKDPPKFYISLLINDQADITPYQKQFNESLVEAVNKQFPLQ